MIICTRQDAPRYRRDGITSHLLVSARTCGAQKLTTTLVEMEPDGTQRPHSHEQEQVYFVLDGKGTMTVGEESGPVCPGDCVHIPSGTLHGLKNSGGSMLRYFSAAGPSFTANSLRSNFR